MRLTGNVSVNIIPRSQYFPAINILLRLLFLLMLLLLKNEILQAFWRIFCEIRRSLIFLPNSIYLIFTILQVFLVVILAFSGVRRTIRFLRDKMSILNWSYVQSGCHVWPRVIVIKFVDINSRKMWRIIHQILLLILRILLL